MKAIFSDYDGTLSKNWIFVDKNRDRINKWMKAGNLFCICTGRTLNSISHVLEDNNINFNSIICCNGAIITDHKMTILKESRLDPSLLYQISDIALRCGVRDLYIGYGHEMKVITNDTAHLYEADVKETVLSLPGYFNQASACFDDHESNVKFYNASSKELCNYINPYISGGCTDCPPREAGKSNGVRMACDILGIGKEDVITIGDNLNDIEMVRDYRGYAISYGRDEVKKYSSGIIDSVWELIDEKMENKS